jgi:hypothetical protein
VLGGNGGQIVLLMEIKRLGVVIPTLAEHSEQPLIARRPLDNWWPLSPEIIPSKSSTSWRRPSDELAMALNVDLVSSCAIPDTGDDNHGQSSISLSCGGGPDHCLLVLLMQVFYVKLEIYVLFLLSLMSLL